MRKRGPLFEAMTRALRRKGIPSAGADRLTLTDHIAVMDLIAAGRAALSTDDDLSLAAVLKSPLIGLDDEALLELAAGRTGPLSSALASARRSALCGRERARFAMACERGALFRRSIFMRASSASMAGAARCSGGSDRRRSDAIDEFMAVALAFSRQDSPSLPAFLEEIEASEAAIKRDMEVESGGVRVMTVHASKGLEAPIVSCPTPVPPLEGGTIRRGSTWVRSPWRSFDLRLDDEEERRQPLHRGRRAAAQDAAAGEHRRLLYVAMTRAAQRLIIAGFDGSKERPADCWYNLVRLGLDPELRAHPAPWIPRNWSGGSAPARPPAADALLRRETTKPRLNG